MKLAKAIFLYRRKKSYISQKYDLLSFMKYTVAFLGFSFFVLIFNSCKIEEPILQNTVECNGSMKLCDKAYNEVVFACTHNAYNYPTEEANFILPNQGRSIEQQLNDGIRAFMLDLYYADENIESDTSANQTTQTIWMYHSLSIAGFVSLKNELELIHEFLQRKPNEVVTLILESYVDYKHFEQIIFETGLDTFLYSPATFGAWLSLQEMIDSNQRLVILTDRKEEVAPNWYIYLWDAAFETHFSNKARGDFSCAVNRGNKNNDLFILNHFITHQNIGTGLIDSAKIINQYDYLLNRAFECESDLGKTPNFITIDFYDSGDVLKVVNDLNHL